MKAPITVPESHQRHDKRKMGETKLLKLPIFLANWGRLKIWIQNNPATFRMPVGKRTLKHRTRPVVNCTLGHVFILIALHPRNHSNIISNHLSTPCPVNFTPSNNIGCEKRKTSNPPPKKKKKHGALV